MITAFLLPVDDKTDAMKAEYGCTCNNALLGDGQNYLVLDDDCPFHGPMVKQKKSTMSFLVLFRMDDKLDIIKAKEYGCTCKIEKTYFFGDYAEENHLVVDETCHIHGRLVAENYGRRIR